MARYIDADKLKTAVNGRSSHWLNDWDTLGVLAIIEEQETEDVAPVIHAHWIRREDSSFKSCSNCMKHIRAKKYPYCPHCGAKMDEAEE